MTIGIDINDVIRDNIYQFIYIYNKFIDPNLEVEYEDVDDFNFLNIFPFKDKNGMIDIDSFNRFKYETYAFELFGRANECDKRLPPQLNLWLQNTMRNFDEEKLPEIVLFSPFEMNLSIQATLQFISRLGLRFRNIIFPVDSYKMWDSCDVIITANPNLLDAKPEDKVSFKVNTPYNKGSKGTYEFDSMLDIIQDEKDTLVKLVEKS